MKNTISILTLLLIGLTGMFPVSAQTPMKVLDKCAATVSSKDGASASFTMNSAQYGSASGTISIKNRMFCTKTETLSMWFDGKTLWTYMAKNDEVNVSTPTENQLQTLNPYNFINLYKEGFDLTMTSTQSSYTVHLTARDQQRKIQEAFITVDKTTYAPKEIKMLQGNKWTNFTVSNLKTQKLSDAIFRFNPAAYPSAEIIDLR